ncbi:RNA-guided endonuclease TnpB family protein [Endozoicomonas sp. 8E]|uniref:RNA-guided endonuclease TnpB family protein n=1 Tax=Endozoicomonas sp. 8E TaxID=3035692 RepID=UPI0029390D61|nr:RNA-guided endonuclease TnpB family protein [Endozoicomonas sp. 8E]WOG29035.1 RNA-guided endonuclease TnpB family protein [Endozoicomonas sp. 8E]
MTLSCIYHYCIPMRAFKYRIYPNAEQKVFIAKHFGCSRHVYNWALSEKDKHYKETGKSLSKRQLQDRLVASKKDDKEWLTDVNSQSLLASLANLDTAFTNFFQGRARFPKFKSKYSGWQSFQCPQHVTVDFEASVMNLPKLKGIKAKLHRPFSGKVKTVTVKRSPSGKYFASVLVDDSFFDPVPVTIERKNTVGLDVGLTEFLIDSEGNKTENPRILKDSLVRLSIEQKKFARKKKGSTNRAKQKRKVAIIHEQVASRRYDFIHQKTANLADKSHATTFAVEDLNIKGMVKNRKLARAIQDAGWGMFLTTLDYKCRWNGKNLIRIGRFQPSSKLCNGCGHKMEAMPLSVREWQCPNCQSVNDRDINAARNIRDIGLGVPV